MWFPPYDLKFNEGSTANWKSTDFIGRPEPVYTYNNTNLTGSISWKIVVDHPSVLNVIVNKVLANETNKVRIDSILESFFAGCRKYDLYELAKKYYTIDPHDLYELQQKITSGTMTQEQLTYAVKTEQTGKDSTNGASQPTSPEVQTNPFEKYNNFGFYFDNDIPKKNSSVTSYENYYSSYVSDTNKTTYANNAPTVTTPYDSSKEGVGNFVKRKRKAQSKRGRGKKGSDSKGKKPINVDTGASKMEEYYKFEQTAKDELIILPPSNLITGNREAELNGNLMIWLKALMKFITIAL
jgi:hypothetical protein